MTRNDQLHKWGLNDSNSCECGEPKTVQHYLLTCTRYEEQREILRKRLVETTGVPYLDLELLLDMKPDD